MKVVWDGCRLGIKSIRVPSLGKVDLSGKINVYITLVESHTNQHLAVFAKLQKSFKDWDCKDPGWQIKLKTITFMVAPQCLHGCWRNDGNDGIPYIMSRVTPVE